WKLALGSFLIGLALWNKAIFVWAAAGLGIAAVLVLWREIRKVLSKRNLSIAAAGFVLGASPFLLYNIRQRNATMRQNAHFDTVQGAMSKWLMVKNNANGNGLLGYMVEEEYDDHPKAVSSTPGRISQWIREHAGQWRETGFYYVLGLLMILVPLWWRS